MIIFYAVIIGLVIWLIAAIKPDSVDNKPDIYYMGESSYKQKLKEWERWDRNR